MIKEITFDKEDTIRSIEHSLSDFIEYDSEAALENIICMAALLLASKRD